MNLGHCNLANNALYLTRIPMAPRPNWKLSVESISVVLLSQLYNFKLRLGFIILG